MAEHPGRHAEAQRLDQRVEAQVLAVAGREAAGLQVDEHLAGAQPLGPAHREVDLARQHDAVVVEVGPQPALGHRSPPRLEAREALEEHVHPLGGLAVQLGPLALAQPAEVVADAGVAGDEAGDGLVDQLAGRRVAPPAHRQLDGLVRHRAARGLRRPGELLRLLGEEQPLAAVDGAEQVLRHPQRLLVGEPRRPPGPAGPPARRAARRAAAGRTPAARGAGRPRAASTSAWAGLGSPTGASSSTSERCHTPWVEWTQCPLVHPPLRPSRPDPRRRRPRARPRRPELPQPAAARRRAAVDQAVGRRRHRSRWSCAAARGRRCRPT